MNSFKLFNDITETNTGDNIVTKAKTVFVTGTIINNPKEGHTYCIQDDYLPNKQLQITFSSNGCLNFNNVSAIDIKLLSQNFKIKNDNVISISKDNLPTSFENTKLPFLLFYDENTTVLSTYNKIDIKLIGKGSYWSSRWDYQDNEVLLDLNKAISVDEIPVDSELLKKQCGLLTDVPVTSGKHPIFITKNRPGFNYLFSFFNNFINYNDKKRLAEQAQATDNYCAARAHFVSLLLNYYGISSLKVFKQYNISEWRKFLPPNVRTAWMYHCASMIIDADNNKWIFDPWEGSSKYLQTVQQWLSIKNEPKPRNLLLAHPCVSMNLNGYDGKINLNKKSGFTHSVFLLFAKAIPNHPEKPLSDKDDWQKKNTKNENMIRATPTLS